MHSLSEQLESFVVLLYQESLEADKDRDESELLFLLLWAVKMTCGAV